MSVQNVRDALERFLTTDTPQVLCIRGAWGSGKTYTFNDILKDLAHTGRLPLKSYAHVSLFGLNSIAEIKREIVQSTKASDRIGKPFDPADKLSLLEKGKLGGKWLADKLSFIHQDAFSAIIEAASLLIRNQIILVDDLERKGDDLRSVDVLGYIAQLRDERDNKVVLVLNDEQLEDKEEFNSYLEKVVDIYLRFSPTPAEIAGIAIIETDNVALKVKERATTLGIDNVRVIRKVLGLVRGVIPMLEKYQQSVAERAISTTTLLGWTYFQPESAPPLEYLKRANLYSAYTEDTPENVKWRDLLTGYGFEASNQFDLTLLKGIENGYFEQADIDSHARLLHNADLREAAKAELRTIWNEMFYSFGLPVKVTLDRFHESYIRNAEEIEAVDMLAIEKLFHDFHDARSADIVDRYVEVYKDYSPAFDIERLEQFGETVPDHVKKKFEAALAAHRPVLSPFETLFNLLHRAFDEDAQSMAAALTVDDYLKVFQEKSGTDLSNILSAIRQYMRISNNSERAVTIMDKAGAALKQLASESPVDDFRARRFGLIQRLEIAAAQKTAQSAHVPIANKET